MLMAQVHVEMLHPDVVEIVRHNPLTHQSVIVVAATAFQPSHNTHHFIDCKPVCLQGENRPSQVTYRYNYGKGGG